MSRVRQKPTKTRDSCTCSVYVKNTKRDLLDNFCPLLRTRDTVTDTLFQVWFLRTRDTVTDTLFQVWFLRARTRSRVTLARRSASARRHGHALLMSEVSHPGKDHRDVVLICGRDHFFVSNRASRLNDGHGTRLCSCIHTIPERKHRIGCQHRALG